MQDRKPRQCRGWTASRIAQAAERPGETDRVVGGKQADKGAWPFQVALLMSEKLDESPAASPTRSSAAAR
jgi:secreted trypsin-like serine protease